MTWVKVCGLRERRHVEAAVEAGADAIGFVIAPSPRQIRPDQAREIGSGVTVGRFLVTVDTPPEQLLAAAEASGVDGVQPHGAHAIEAAAAAAESGYSVLFPVKAASWAGLAPIPPQHIPLFDTPHGAVHGGTGETFDWSTIPTIERRFVLAGGLNPDNVVTALAEVQPWGVDASSGLESSPGEKDPDLIRSFLKKVKGHEAHSTR